MKIWLFFHWFLSSMYKVHQWHGFTKPSSEQSKSVLQSASTVTSNSSKKMAQPLTTNLSSSPPSPFPNSFKITLWDPPLPHKRSSNPSKHSLALLNVAVTFPVCAFVSMHPHTVYQNPFFLDQVPLGIKTKEKSIPEVLQIYV